MEILSAFMTAEGVGYWVPRQNFGGKYFIANLAMKKTIAILTILVTPLFKVRHWLKVQPPLRKVRCCSTPVNDSVIGHWETELFPQL